MTSLRQRMIEELQMRNLSPHTQTAYIQQISRFSRYFAKSPDQLGPDEIRAYQIYLTNERKLSPASIQIAVCALCFFYKVTLKRDWSFEDVLPRPKKPQRLPIVLSPELDFGRFRRRMRERFAFDARCGAEFLYYPGVAGT
jgi:integrase/recombinase XerD